MDEPGHVSPARLTVVGIGMDGWAGLGEGAQDAIAAAELVVGSARQLALVPAPQGSTRKWPSPIDALVDELVAGTTGPACILASGDPMLFGIGATLAARVDPGRLVVHPHPSALAYASARLAWPQADIEVITVVGRPMTGVARALQPGRRIIVYVSGRSAAADIAGMLRDRGLGASRIVVLEELGGPGERVTEGLAADWGERRVEGLHVVAVECLADRGVVAHPRVPGLDDHAYESDGQLTKREVRAVTIAALGPLPDELLWDVGAGSGSIAIEWLRAEASARAIAIERDPERAARAGRNALALGVPALEILVGAAPEALAGLDEPDVVFVGGGVTTPGVLDICWAALRPGGRMVVNAVTIEGERVLHAAHAAKGGRLVRIALSHAEPIGGFTTWRPQLPVVQWSARKEDA